MANMSRMRLTIVVLIILTLGLTACTRSASTPPPATDEGLPSGAQSETQATMDAVRSAILTQTAQALGDPIYTSTPTPLPVSDPLVTATPELDKQTATPDGGYREYTVKPGDWIFKIARDFGVDPQAIIDLNELTNPAELEVGMVLKIPTSDTAPPATADGTGTPVEGGTIHVVKSGEWIWSIARLYGIDPQAIIDANNLASPGTIYPGDELIIP
ncbi:MAG: LysM peptidoglycan-binding domain-containing protein [Chloroflexi bacterium]|nr:LysM peptidoglycan-binding domain-containing protein [Chloroflexota bacterium]